LNYLVLTTIVCLSLGSMSAASPDLEILVPDSRVCVNHGHVMIVGKTEATIVDIILDAASYASIPVIDSFFHKQVEFGYGLHEIKIIPVYSGISTSITDTATIEVIYAPKVNFEFKTLYPDYWFHIRELDPVCLDCHDVNYADLDKVEGTESCLSCHVSLRDNFIKHTKGEDETCFLCHDLGADLVAVIDEQTESKNPCFKCHQDKIKSFDQEYVHGPVAGGSCLICHASHGSDNEHLLNLPEDMLCFECHSDVEKQVKALVVHQPFIEGKCGECHDPHSTNNEWILKVKSEAVCLSCHDPEGDLKEHEHPFAVKPKRKLQNHLELTSDGRLECLTCHNAHSSDQTHMVKSDSNLICLGCHMDLL